MARSSLFRQIARVRGRVAEQLGETIPVTLHRADPEDRDPITGEPALSAVGPMEAKVEGADGVSVGADKTEPGSRLIVTIFDPDVAVTEDDSFSWGATPAGQSRNLHRVRKVLGVVQDPDGSRYVSRCEVD